MKNTIFIFVILFNFSIFSQTEYDKDSFKNEIFKLKIVKRDGVSDKFFNKGKYIFGEATRNDLKSAADYHNLAVSLSYLGEDKNLIKYAIDKAFSLDSEAMFRLYEFLKENNTVEYEKGLKRFPSIKGRLLKLKEEKSLYEIKDKDTLNIKSYCKNNGLDISLVQLINTIVKTDQKYRKKDYIKNLTKQNKIDSVNLFKIDSLYKRYDTYIGKSLVGDKFSYVMWLVIQHSNINKMEKYLPILLEAVKKKELKLTPLKMLIDRIYTIKFGYQIFGSQMGVDIAKESIRKEVIDKYNLNGLDL